MKQQLFLEQAMEKISLQFPDTPPAILSELFMAEYQMAWPDDDAIADGMIRYCEDLKGKNLIVCDRIPMAVMREEFEECGIRTEDLASRNAAETLLKAHPDQSPEVYDHIFCFISLTQLAEYKELVLELQRKLKPEGVLYLMEENRMGFHRLGTFLMNEVSYGFPEQVKCRHLTRLGLKVKEHIVESEFEPYEALFHQLEDAYPQNKHPMRNTLYRWYTVFEVQGGELE